MLIFVVLKNRSKTFSWFLSHVEEKKTFHHLYFDHLFGNWAVLWGWQCGFLKGKKQIIMLIWCWKTRLKTKNILFVDSPNQIYSYVIHEVMFSREKFTLKYLTSIFKGSATCSGNTLFWYSPSHTLSFSTCVVQFWKNCIAVTCESIRKNVSAAGV